MVAKSAWKFESLAGSGSLPSFDHHLASLQFFLDGEPLTVGQPIKPEERHFSAKLLIQSTFRRASIHVERDFRFRVQVRRADRRGWPRDDQQRCEDDPIAR